MKANEKKNLSQSSRIKVERFQQPQAEDVAKLIHRNIIVIHNQDYPKDFIENLLESFKAEKLIEKSKEQHIFVATLGDEIIGTAGLANFGTAEQPAYYAVAVFVMTEYHRLGIGSLLMDAVEEKAWQLNAERITVRSAVNAKGFYQRLGYDFVGGLEKPNDLGQYLMEKFRNKGSKNNG